MTDQQYADLVLEEMQAHREHIADPSDQAKFDTWCTLSRQKSQALNERQLAQLGDKYPVVQFERLPDEGLLPGV